jgi:hypothetical protein
LDGLADRGKNRTLPGILPDFVHVVAMTVSGGQQRACCPLKLPCISFFERTTVGSFTIKPGEVLMRRILALLLTVFALSLGACGTPSQEPPKQPASQQ